MTNTVSSHPKPLGKQIKEYRKFHGISQKAFGEQVGLGALAVGGIESGKTKNPREKTLRRIRKLLGYGPELADNQVTHVKGHAAALKGVTSYGSTAPSGDDGHPNAATLAILKDDDLHQLICCYARLSSRMRGVLFNVAQLLPYQDEDTSDPQTGD